MKRDPIVAEVRRIRQEHAARFDYDLNLIVKDLKAQERVSGRSYISLPPRRAKLRTDDILERKPVDEPQGADSTTRGATRTGGQREDTADAPIAD